MFSDLNTLLQSIGLVGICAIIFIESGFPFGFFLPGDTLLFTTGLLAAQGHFNIALAIMLIFASSVAGVTI
ncbi:MAG: DedA family protein, partial [Microcoleus sp.]